jgi:immunity protein, SdpI family
MHRRIFQLAVVLLWLALPLVATQYTEVWNQLPARMATHFNAAGEANGWMTRGEAVNFTVGFMAFLLTIFTALLLYNARQRVDTFSWAALGFCALILGVMVEVNRGMVNYSRHGSPLQVGPLLVALPIAAILLIVIYIVSRREPALASTATLSADLLVEETHSGRAAALFILPALIGLVFAASAVPAPALRLSLALVGLIGLAMIAAAWSGFQYRFLRHGLEIRALGFRLRSIPRQQIQSYAVEPWSALRGYGIRGVGNSRAYVWTNKVVHIKTLNGDIFLGHSDPQRIVRDLDRVMGH